MKRSTVLLSLFCLIAVPAAGYGWCPPPTHPLSNGPGDRKIPGTATPAAENEYAASRDVALLINEFMADNDSMFEDPDDPGEYADWIEIYNGESFDVDLGGMYLTDDVTDPTQHAVPAGVTVPANGYVVFIADDEVDQGDLHLNFKLGASGEDIGLFDTDGVTEIDSLTFGEQYTDISYGRSPDGSETWGYLAVATPGAANGDLNSPPEISGTAHTPSAPGSADDVWISATVTDDSAVSSVVLTYDAGAGAVEVTMYDDGAHGDGNAGDLVWGGMIPSQTDATVVSYYLTATDNLDTSVTDPAGAPSATYFYTVGYAPPALYINEFMADNDAAYEDPDDPGDYEDWIEIYNAGTSDVDLGGMYLTDDLADPTQWPVPAGLTVPADGYLVLWADDETDQGDTHMNFKLGAGGEQIGLFDTDATGHAAIDQLTFGEQTTDVSQGRCPDGSDNWEFFIAATPGAANEPCAGTVDAGLTCMPSSGTVPFGTQMTIILTNRCSGLTRRLAGQINVFLAGGGYLPGWRAGFTDVTAGGSYTASWVTTIPALGAVIGDNVFELLVVDVTPAPYNQPPYPESGATAMDACTVTGIAP